MAIIKGTPGDDRYPNELEGTNGDDEIFGFAGRDTLIGFNGDDVLEGGAGADELFGSSGFDYASYRGSNQGVYINLDSFGADGGHADGDELYSIEGLIGSSRTDHLYGSAERNVLRGEGGDDDLQGGGGDDRLSGGSGRDILIGDAGADELRGDAGTDFVMYYGSDQAVTVNLATGKGYGGDAEGDRFVSVEAVQGSNYADRITGNGAANLLRGDGGADIVAGGGGADRFYVDAYASSRAEPDRILDFSRAQGDKILPSEGNEDRDGFQAFHFIGKNAFTDVGQLRWYQQNGDTIIEGNTSNATPGAELKLVLDPLINLQSSDFMFAEILFAPPIQA